MNRRNEILVGVDGSKESDAAVAWAAREARIRGAGLLIVHACDPQSYGLWMTTSVVRSGLREMMQPIIDKALTHARALEPDVQARGGILVAAPSRTLIRLSGRVELTVIGRSGRGALSRLLLGSVTTRVLANASCPVVVVDRPGRSNPDGSVERIVAAVDDPSTHEHTLFFAFEEAARRHIPVRLIRAIDSAKTSDELQRRYAEQLAPWHARYPKVHGMQEVHVGPLATVIEGVCSPRDLLVLGHHRHVPFTPHALGWKATSIVRAAPCAVTVVHEPVDELGLPVHTEIEMAAAT